MYCDMQERERYLPSVEWKNRESVLRFLEKEHTQPQYPEIIRVLIEDLYENLKDFSGSLEWDEHFRHNFIIKESFDSLYDLTTRALQTLIREELGNSELAIGIKLIQQNIRTDGAHA